MQVGVAATLQNDAALSTIDAISTATTTAAAATTTATAATTTGELLDCTVKTVTIMKMKQDAAN